MVEILVTVDALGHRGEAQGDPEGDVDGLACRRGEFLCVCVCTYIEREMYTYIYIYIYIHIHIYI